MDFIFFNYKFGMGRGLLQIKSLPLVAGGLSFISHKAELF